MRFDELPMYDAIYQVREEMLANGETPGGNWDTDETKRRELTRRVLGRLIDNVDQRIIDAWCRFRKSCDVNGKKKLELIVEVARKHGSRCFYADRGLGPCSPDVDLDRIIPGARGGQYDANNCLIVCSKHNRSRGEKTIEDFVLTGKSTPLFGWKSDDNTSCS